MYGSPSKLCSRMKGTICAHHWYHGTSLSYSCLSRRSQTGNSPSTSASGSVPLSQRPPFTHQNYPKTTQTSPSESNGIARYRQCRMRYGTRQPCAHLQLPYARRCYNARSTYSCPRTADRICNMWSIPRSDARKRGLVELHRNYDRLASAQPP